MSIKHRGMTKFCENKDISIAVIIKRKTGKQMQQIIKRLNQYRKEERQNIFELNLAL